MRKIFMIAPLLSLLALPMKAQNTGETFETFKQQRSEQENAFADRREKEFAEFKARYYAAFEEFRELYRNYLKEEEAVLDLMASDDGIKIKPVRKAQVPKVVTTVSEQKDVLKNRIIAVDTMRADDFLPVFSEEKDTLARMQEAAQVMEDIVSGMREDGESENGMEGNDSLPESEAVVEVVLEPFDPEYFSSLPDVGEVEEQCTESPNEGTGSLADSYAEDIPHGKPTDYVRISSPFGTRIHPITHRKHTHKGVDLAAPKMKPVYATADGVVTFSGRNGGYGNFVKINHRNGYKTAYAHMHRIEVKNNAEVHKGDLIGYVGSTGSSTGNHLHYELYYQDGLLDPATTL